MKVYIYKNNTEDFLYEQEMNRIIEIGNINKNMPKIQYEKIAKESGWELKDISWKEFAKNGQKYAAILSYKEEKSCQLSEAENIVSNYLNKLKE